MQKTCLQCQNSFEIAPEDLAFYDKISPIFDGKKMAISSPTLCPNCRWIRKASFRNFKNLYHRKSDLSGKPLISIYSPEKAFPVYSHEEWWSDQWNALNYGQDFDFNRPFFEQYFELYSKVPKAAVHVSNSENCTYTNMSFGSQNCYLVFGNINNQDCYYSHILWESRTCFDMLYSFGNEQCYECIDSENCYRCSYCMDVYQCSESSHLFNCRNCSNCFGCINLVNQKYCILNQAYSKEEYEKKRAYYATPEGQAEFFTRWKALYQAAPRRAAIHFNCEEVTGNHIYNSRRCFSCFDLQNSEDCKYCLTGAKMRDCYDCIYNGAGQELSYETLFSIGYRLLFCKNILAASSNLLYSIDCGNVKDCFGCVGLRNHEEFCILNKRYTKEEYETLVPRIIAHMQKTGEWGEYFPSRFSPFAYNESIAHDYFPLQEAEVLARGLQWFREEDKETLEQYVGPPATVIGPITGVSDDICKAILRCEVTGKPYRILPQELAFYRSMQIQIPRRCPEQRHMERMARRNPRLLWSRFCADCQAPIQSAYSPNRPERVICEACYLKMNYG